MWKQKQNKKNVLCEAWTESFVHIHRCQHMELHGNTTHIYMHWALSWLIGLRFQHSCCHLSFHLALLKCALTFLMMSLVWMKSGKKFSLRFFCSVFFFCGSRLELSCSRDGRVRMWECYPQNALVHLELSLWLCFLKFYYAHVWRKKKKVKKKVIKYLLIPKKQIYFKFTGHRNFVKFL